MSGSRNSNRSDDALRRIDEVLSSIAPATEEQLHEAAKWSTNRRLEEIFPGLAEDERTASGIYEPDIRHYAPKTHTPTDTSVYRPSIAEALKQFSGYLQDLDDEDLVAPNLQGVEPTIQEARQLHSSRQTERETSAMRSDQPPAASRFESMLPQSQRTSSRLPYQHELDLHPSDPWANVDSRGSRVGDFFYSQNADEDSYGYGPAMEHVPLSDSYWTAIDKHNEGIRARYKRLRLGEQQNSLREQRTARSRPGTRSRPVRGNIRGAMHPTVSRAIASNRPFSSGGRRHPGGTIRGRTDIHPFSGLMEGNASELFHQHLQDNAIDYVIYSYNTPIAWRTTHTEGENEFNRWHVPRQRHTITTSRHQSAVHHALRENNFRSVGVETDIELQRMAGRQRESPRVGRRFYNLMPDRVDTYEPSSASSNEDFNDRVNTAVRVHLRNIVEPQRVRRLRNRRVRPDESHGQPQLPLE